MASSGAHEARAVLARGSHCLLPGDCAGLMSMASGLACRHQHNSLTRLHCFKCRLRAREMSVSAAEHFRESLTMSQAKASLTAAQDATGTDSASSTAAASEAEAEFVEADRRAAQEMSESLRPAAALESEGEVPPQGVPADEPDDQQPAKSQQELQEEAAAAFAGSRGSYESVRGMASRVAAEKAAEWRRKVEAQQEEAAEAPRHDAAEL